MRCTLRRNQYTHECGKQKERKRIPPKEQSQKTPCGKCGFRHTKPEHCSASGKKCSKCQKVGHFAAVCRSKSVSEVRRNADGATEGSSDDHWFLGALSSDSQQDNKWKVQLKVSGKPIVFKIDTGADITAMSKTTFDSLPIPTQVTSVYDSPFQSRR